MEVKYKERLNRDREGAARALNKGVSSTEEAIEYVADQRYAETSVRDIGLREHSKGVITPGVNDDGGAVDEGEVNKTVYTAIAARANYLAQDRPNIQFAAKQVSRFMSKPEARDLKRARRLGGYLKCSVQTQCSIPSEDRSRLV